MEFIFDDGYQLTTFFNWFADDQWTLFLPDQTNISVDCSSLEAIKDVQLLSEQVPLVETYKKLDIFQKDISVIEITYDKHNLPTLNCDNDISVTAPSPKGEGF